MRREYGENISISIFGESHGDEIGVVIGGLPEGVCFDPEELAAFMARRAPGAAADCVAEAVTTPRKEPDEVRFTAGVRDAGGGRLCIEGPEVRAEIVNQDHCAADYEELRTVLRPGHADLAVYLKEGAEGLRPGGGRFSGRMTAPMCIAGGILMQLLAERGITISAYYTEIGGKTSEEEILCAIRRAREDQDSLGGIVECIVRGFPAGVGGPLYEGLEGKIAGAVFAIPAVKGIEFGSGFAGSRYRGSRNNDTILLVDDPEGVPSGSCPLRTETNHAGGINGGISNGMEIVFRAAFKPVPTIGAPQRTVDISRMQEVELRAQGRHDLCVVPRAVPVVEAAAAIALYDALAGEP